MGAWAAERGQMLRHETFCPMVTREVAICTCGVLLRSMLGARSCDDPNGSERSEADQTGESAGSSEGERAGAGGVQSDP